MGLIEIYSLYCEVFNIKGVYFIEGFDLNKKKLSGIEKKIVSQIRCLKTMGELEVISLWLDESIVDRIKFLMPFIYSRREKQRKVLLGAVESDTDYIYIRKPSLSYKFYRLLKQIKKKNPYVKIYMEIPTYPFHNEYKGFSRLMVCKSIPCEKKMYKVIDRIITFSDDSYIWKIPCINLANCVDFDQIKPRISSYQCMELTIRLTCVAAFNYWHGLDRLIAGIDNYKGVYTIILNVVGDGPEIPRLKSMTMNKNIIFHGFKSGADLDKIFDETDIAVDALGRHRAGVFYNSSLKGKEYAARGIPIISAVNTEFDYVDDFPFYLKLPSDDTIINIQTVIEFYEKIYNEKSADAIISDIRNYSYKKFDFNYGFLKPIKKELNVLV